jgi:hypothetical protein
MPNIRNTANEFIESDFPSRLPVWKEILLWIAFIPAALFASNIVFWLSLLVMWFGSNYYNWGIWFELLWHQVATNVMCGYSFVYIASYVAPRGKTQVAITLAAITIFFSGLSALFAIRDQQWMDLLGIACLISGSVVCAVQISRVLKAREVKIRIGCDSTNYYNQYNNALKELEIQQVDLARQIIDEK